MGLGGAMVGGIVAAVIGATAWALIAYFANFEIGWVAWGIGALVGYGVFIGGGRKAGFGGGVLAVVLAVASIAAGKYAVVQVEANAYEADQIVAIDQGIAARHDGDRNYLGAMANRIADERTQTGNPVVWPNTKTSEGRTLVSDYPPELLQEASTRLEAMNATEKEDYKTAADQQKRAASLKQLAIDLDAAKSQAFASAWSLFDLLFVVLAVLSAWRIGSAKETA